MVSVSGWGGGVMRDSLPVMSSMRLGIKWLLSMRRMVVATQTLRGSARCQ